MCDTLGVAGVFCYYQWVILTRFINLVFCQPIAYSLKRVSLVRTKNRQKFYIMNNDILDEQFTLKPRLKKGISILALVLIMLWQCLVIYYALIASESYTALSIPSVLAEIQPKLVSNNSLALTMALSVLFTKTVLLMIFYEKAQNITLGHFALGSILNALLLVFLTVTLASLGLQLLFLSGVDFSFTIKIAGKITLLATIAYSAILFFAIALVRGWNKITR